MAVGRYFFNSDRMLKSLEVYMRSRSDYSPSPWRSGIIHIYLIKCGPARVRISQACGNTNVCCALFPCIQLICWWHGVSVLNESEERLTAQPEELPSDTGQLLLLLLLGLSGFFCFHLHVYLHSSGKALSSPVVTQIWLSHCLDCVPDI